MSADPFLFGDTNGSPFSPKIQPVTRLFAILKLRSLLLKHFKLLKNRNIFFESTAACKEHLDKY